MKHLITFLFLGLCSLLPWAGCQHRYEEVDALPGAGREKLRTDASVYVAIPFDARFKGELVMNSGKLTAEVVQDSFKKFVKRAYGGRKVESLEESLQTAREHQITYLAHITLLRWEDRATEYSGRTDKLELRIDVLDVETGETLHSKLIRGKSRWMTDGGDAPQDLLPEPVDRFVASLFQVTHVPSAMQRQGAPGRKDSF